MPTRFLKESICTSETLAKLSPEEERAFYRLLVNCDDYGRTDARPAILRASLFPLSVDTISLDDIRCWMQALQDAGLITVYVVKDRPYLEVVTWQSHQNVRASKSRWPDPLEGETSRIACIGIQPHTDASNGMQMSADAPVSRISLLDSRISSLVLDKTTESADSVGAPDGATATIPEKLRAYQERLAVAKPNKVAIVGDAFAEFFGWKANHGRIGRILGKYSAAYELIKLIVQIAPTWNGVDDPHDYLQKAVEAKRNGTRNGHANGRLNPIIKASELTPPAADDEPVDERIDDEGLTAEDRAAIREHEHRLQFEAPYRIWWEEAEPYVTAGRSPPKPAPKARAAQVWR